MREALERGWGDGLPLVPPTEHRVTEFVEASGKEPDEVVGYVKPEGGAATVEKIAVNAVMAGCQPGYTPVLLACVRGLVRPEFNFGAIQATTNPVAPLVIVNGPVRMQLHVNCGRGALGPGRRANATIGRALRLIALNLGGASPGPVDKAIHGSPGKYTMVIGENEEESPWESLSQDRGLKGKSAVTLVGVEGTSNNLTLYKEPESILHVLANSMRRIGAFDAFHPGEPVVLIAPGHAELFQRAGMSKMAIKHWLYEHSSIPVADFPTEKTTSDMERDWMFVEAQRVSPAASADSIILVVSGGGEPYHAVHLPSFSTSRSVTEPV